MQLTKDEWLRTLNGITEYPNGILVGQVFREDKFQEDEWLMLAGGNPMFEERLAGAKSQAQKVVSTADMLTIKSRMFAKTDEQEWDEI